MTTVSAPPKVPSQSTLFVFGSITAVLLLIILLNGLRSDLRSQLNESSHRSSEVALNVAQAIRVPLRTSANAITFVAEESNRLQRTAPQQSDALLQGLIAEILRRQPQILGIAFVDTAAPKGDATTTVPARAALATCHTDAPVPGEAPCFGPLTDTPRGPTLSVVAPLAAHQWVVGDVQANALKRTAENIPHINDIFFKVVDVAGQTIVQGGNEAAAPAPGDSSPPWWVGSFFGLHDVAPLWAQAQTEPYPFRVIAGINYQRALAPWHRQVATAIAFYLLYLFAFVSLQSVMYRATRMQRYYIQSLQAKTHDLHVAQRVGRTAIWTLHDGHFQCTDEAGEIFGFADGRSNASVPEFLSLIVPKDREHLIEQVKIAWRNDAPLRAEFHIKRPDGNLRRLSAGGQLVVDQAGVKRMTGTVVDVTEQWEAHQQQAESEQRFRSLFDHNPLPFWVFDVATLNFLEVNAAAQKAYDYTREEFLGMTILDIRDPEWHPDLVTHLSTSSEARKAPREWVHRTKSGQAIDVRIHAANIVFNGRPARLVLAEDITAHLAGEREMAYQALHDVTTRLPNQHALFHRLDDLIAGGSNFDIAYMQLIGLDAIADTFGIDVPTGILQGVAERLIQYAGNGAFLATVTNEAFALVAPAGQLTPVKLHEIVQAITEPLHYEETQHQIDVVIGVANHPRDSAQSDVLLGHAALASHAHIRSGQPIHYFTASLAQQSREKLHLSARLRRAVKRHEFELHFQPVTNYPDRQLVGLEALIRWPQDDGTIILPSTFIPMCEESGLIVPLGRWVLNQAAKASLQLKEAGFDVLPIGVNISPAELRSDLVANLRAIRQAYSLAERAIHIELTESSLIEHKDKAIGIMKQLKADGVAVALDDFGTGFSSLSYLRDLPIDMLKIDQAFIRNVDWDARSSTICEAIIALGKSLKIQVIAEGIERSSQYRWLYKHGCDAAQGFYLGKPERLTEFMAQWHSAKAKAR
ncbi:putative bifunctional diguanylate cyclase/phosphodiesterase [Dyella mobilis]|uniref:EAL domain-containing protein n=1 Tax=Dyella mobilis TaxID=1849582 RepID=A0ABS2KCI6_9GAMM|nr:GGDEF domain-containing phosphodiesterase [Dyella mobilis]MBM7128886.1 EAL domain-containing protein [Dyella mobilis]